MQTTPSPLVEVAVRFTTEAGRSLVLTVDPTNFRVDVRSGDLADISSPAREAIVVGVQRAIALERDPRTP
ncbi:hypothetical protein [Agromyces sp. CCNWLW203]|uniref:hypothetical protein n=1 Tax=Agromyces sp. CCNWLW203 TaxID=3112842 RepID=UPI002F9642FF